jgi:hypothetical protein
MKRTLPAILIAFFSLSTFNSIGSNPTEWEIYFANDTVKIEYTYQNCEYTEHFNSEYVVFKITNTIKKNITVEWQEQLWYDENCINCETVNKENRKQITIVSASVNEGKCNMNNSLRIFSKFTENLDKMPGVTTIMALTKFELINIKIK